MTDLSAVGAPDRKFQIFTGILKAGGSAEEGMTLTGVASSTIRDLHGDAMLESAIRDMEVQANKGLTIFLNHEYRVPEDVAGSTSGARAVQRGTDQDGNPIWDLDLDIDINDENSRAVEAWKSIRKKGTKLGLSIGANIPEGGWERNDAGRYDIKHINLLETSIVGIPANPRSWISKAVDAISDFESLGQIDGVAPEEMKEAPPADDRDDLESIEEEKTACPECGDQDIEACNNPRHRRKDAETATEDVLSPEELAEEIDRIESEDEPLEASSDPAEVEPLEGEAVVVSSAIESLEKVNGEVNVTHLQMAVEIAKSLHAQNTAITRERDEALKAKKAAERELAETVERTSRILAGTREIIEDLKNTPLGRKTAVQKTERKLAHLEGTYGPEFMKMLEK